MASLSHSDAGLEVIEPVQVWAIDDMILDYKAVDWQALVDGFPDLNICLSSCCLLKVSEDPLLMSLLWAGQSLGQLQCTKRTHDHDL